MYIDFNQLKPESRIWVYTSSYLLSDQTIIKISEKLLIFCNAWQSHQMDMKASFLIAENRFIIIAADESYNDISGCGIDKSIHAIQELEQELSLKLTDKSVVVFEKEGLQLAYPFNKIREAVSLGDLNSEILFYNTLVSTISEYKTDFKIKASEGWVKKYFNILVS